MSTYIFVFHVHSPSLNEDELVVVYIGLAINTRPFTVSHLHSCEVLTLHLENCANARRIHVSWVINPLFMNPCGGAVETSTIPRPVPECRQRSCEVSTLHLEICVNARRVYFFE